MTDKRKDYTLKNKSGQDQVLRVAELFAGVGGFRLGLEGLAGKKKKHQRRFKTVWFNQWEPATKTQHAFSVYANRFGNIDWNSNRDIASVVNEVPEHDLLVGGFPCQDYSVARNLSASQGLVGKKGVLWWSIHGILKTKGEKAPRYLMLENVDRLLKSPASQRGRDFAVILSTLNELGYMVEWRVINAADYGMPQRRRRIFIMGYKKSTPPYERFRRSKDAKRWLLEEGVVRSEFPAIQKGELESFEIPRDPVKTSEEFNTDSPRTSPFRNSGLAFDNKAYTLDVKSVYTGNQMTLGQILLDDDEISEQFYLKKGELKQWKYLKGAKREPRKAKSGFAFTYTEGPIAFPDPLDKPSRTIITGEGGPTPSRFKHVVKTKKGLRRLTPVELERLNMFPDNHTEGHSDAKRAFFMGNALVVGVIDKLGKALIVAHDSVSKK